MSLSNRAVNFVACGVYLVAFVAIWLGFGDSGTVDEPGYSGMLVALVFLVSVVWCWAAAIRLVAARLRPSRWRTTVLIGTAASGWLIGPLVILSFGWRKDA